MADPPSWPTILGSLEAADLAFMDRNKSPVKKADELWKVIRDSHDVTLTREVDRKHKVEHVEVA